MTLSHLIRFCCSLQAFDPWQFPFCFHITHFISLRLVHTTRFVPLMVPLLLPCYYGQILVEKEIPSRRGYSLVARVLVFTPGSTYTEYDGCAGNLNPSSQEVEIAGSEVQGHLWLSGENLRPAWVGYTTPYHRK